MINLRPVYPWIGTIWSSIVPIRFLQLVAMLSFVFCVFKIAMCHLGLKSQVKLENSEIASYRSWRFLLGQCHGLPQREAAAHGSAAGRVREQPLDVDGGCIGQSCTMQRWRCLPEWGFRLLQSSSILRIQASASSVFNQQGFIKDSTLNISLSSHKRWDVHPQNRSFSSTPLAPPHISSISGEETETSEVPLLGSCL